MFDCFANTLFCKDVIFWGVSFWWLFYISIVSLEFIFATVKKLKFSVLKILSLKYDVVKICSVIKNYLRTPPPPFHNLLCISKTAQVVCLSFFDFQFNFVRSLLTRFRGHLASKTQIIAFFSSLVARL